MKQKLLKNPDCFGREFLIEILYENQERNYWEKISLAKQPIQLFESVKAKIQFSQFHILEYVREASGNNFNSKTQVGNYWIKALLIC